MTMRTVQTTTAPQAVGPYSQAIEYEKTIYCSGQIPLVPETHEIIPGGIKEQTQQVIQNLARVLEAGGSGLNHVLKTTVYMTDLSQFKEMNEVYGTFFSNHKPARSTVQVAALPMGALIEIEAIGAIVR